MKPPTRRYPPPPEARRPTGIEPTPERPDWPRPPAKTKAGHTRRVIIQVSAQHIAKFLRAESLAPGTSSNLPEDARIVSARFVPAGDRVEFIMESAEFKEVPHNKKLPYFTVLHKRADELSREEGL